MKRLLATTPPEPNPVFGRLAPEARVQAVLAALGRNGIGASVVDTGEEACRLVLDRLPDGTEVFTSTSTTLDTIGLTDAINQSPRFRALQPRLREMDRETQAREIRRLRSAPDVVVGSVHAITEDGQLLVASASGSQLGPYAWGAGAVIWLAGTQKLVADLDEGMRRIEEYCYPLEDRRSRKVYGEPSSIRKVLIINREDRPGRMSVILVRQQLGF
jgi:hypothetical protein